MAWINPTVCSNARPSWSPACKGTFEWGILLMGDKALFSVLRNVGLLLLVVLSLCDLQNAISEWINFCTNKKKLMSVTFALGTRVLGITDKKLPQNCSAEGKSHIVKSEKNLDSSPDLFFTGHVYLGNWLILSEFASPGTGGQLFVGTGEKNNGITNVKTVPSTEWALHERLLPLLSPFRPPVSPRYKERCT